MWKSSSHKQRWLFDSSESLVRNNSVSTPARKLNQHSICIQNSLKKTQVADGEISASEEQVLISYYGGKLFDLSRKTLKLPDSVTSTALTYLRRFYVRKSCIEVDPQCIVLTCLYVACKVEDWYVSAEQIEKHSGLPEDLILKFELVLLQGLGFDLLVLSPYDALEGLEGSLGDLYSKTEARQWIDRVLVSTNAILLYSPGQIALKSVLSSRNENVTEEEVLGALKGVVNFKRLDDLDPKSMGEDYSHEDVKAIDKKLKKLVMLRRQKSTTATNNKNDDGQ